MKSYLSIVTLICALLMPLSGIAQTKATAPPSTSTEATTPTKVTGLPTTVGKTKTSKPVKGIVVSLITLKPVKGADAGAMANKNALGLMVGSRIYYVLKADGSSAGDDLARLADAPVGVIGKTMSRGGMTVFLADIIDTMK
jgi:hypothetical protein